MDQIRRIPGKFDKFSSPSCLREQPPSGALYLAILPPPRRGFVTGAVWPGTRISSGMLRGYPVQITTRGWKTFLILKVILIGRPAVPGAELFPLKYKMEKRAGASLQGRVAAIKS